MSNLTDCTVNVSSSVTLSCPSRGVPPPTITWYKDQRALLQGSGKEILTRKTLAVNRWSVTYLMPSLGIVISAEEARLHIDRITVEDEGLYTCQATNERGSAESSAYIWVSGKNRCFLIGSPHSCICNTSIYNHF